jgi:predicted transcriptional regulator
MKKLKPWSQLQKNHFSDEEIAQHRADALKELEATEYALAFLRKTLDITQAELAERLDKKQAEISLLEHRSDHKISTLRAYVAALGGELVVSAKFGDKYVQLALDQREPAAE